LPSYSFDFVVHDNEGSGVAYLKRSGGEARDNVSSENGYYGVLIADQADPALTGNTFQNNDDSGMVYLDDAGGTAEDNLVTENGSDGIYVGGQAAPVLKRNKSLDNDDTGIAYFGNATGIVQDNRFAGNATHGVYVADNATPTLGRSTVSAILMIFWRASCRGWITRCRLKRSLLTTNLYTKRH
jgi:parallel beta-helix repeat protein